MFKASILILTLALFFGSRPVLALDDVDNLSKWNWGIDFHGEQSQTGESLSLATPHLGVFQFRLSLGEDSVYDSGSQSGLSYTTMQLAAIIYQYVKPESPIRPYLGISYDLYFGSGTTIPGNYGGYSVFPGVQIWQKIGESKWVQSGEVAFFIEGGPTFSNLLSADSTGNQRLGTGFLMKLGIMRDF